ncbi:hypothetical protein [Pseudomonas sp. PDM22]|uniref:hypothetical protein n=1 Tax=Pseudomonas sp. PDM22 TaxID=2769287 RepID=UPI0009D96C19|nr:hypothetical protein [Pseudomonas sp. PDM22]MBD9516101.1 hypothetical protein [Pseudomonas sp. PDM22]OQR32889.1 hypothetical protein BWR15_15655 [Pseudomonas sp. T]
MAVDLDSIPAAAVRPSSPRWLLWLGLLPVLVFAGVAAAVGLGGEGWAQHPQRFWWTVLGWPLLLWCAVLGCRWLVYAGQQLVADGWDERREAFRDAETRRGRRSLSVLAVNMQTAFLSSSPRDQIESLLGQESALKMQPAGDMGGEARCSRLPCGPEDTLVEQMTGALSRLLADMAAPLALLPKDVPLSVRLMLDSSLDEEQRQTAWDQAWADSGIRQPVTWVHVEDLEIIDQWLDEQSPPLLLVVALRISPEALEGSAEAAVGLLLQRSGDASQTKLAVLHRPERYAALRKDPVRHAVERALLWAALSPSAVNQAWLAGIDPQQAGVPVAVLEDLGAPARPGKGIHDLTWSLGAPGQLAPWLAIATAVGAACASGSPQLLLSDGAAFDGALWCAVLKPASASASVNKMES